MTDQRYLDDSTVRKFETRVERVIDDGETARVVLDATYFYPEGGGQPADHGALSDTDTWPVLDVQKTDTIYHTIEGDGPTAGERVMGTLDWERRRAHMRYHTAQHLLSALLLEEYDAVTTGNQLYIDHARLDCEYDRFSQDDLADIEARMNALIEEARNVRWYTLGRTEAETRLDPERTRLELLPNSITEVRIVEIGEARRASNVSGGRSGGVREPREANSAERSSADHAGSEGLRPSDHSSGDEPREDERSPRADGEERPVNGEHGDPRTVYDRVACAGTHVSTTDEIGRVEVTGRETRGTDEERLRFVIEDE